jgi:hypothetical protein
MRFHRMIRARSPHSELARAVFTTTIPEGSLGDTLKAEH